jgi:hypothetical protein
MLKFTFTKDEEYHTIFINKMINPRIIKMFIFIIFVFIYSILLAICTDNRWYFSINIGTHTCVCLEVNTHPQTLDYFTNDKHIKDCVLNVPKDVYLGV